MKQIKPLTKLHWNCVKRIFQKGIDSGNATFETVIPSWDLWDKNHLSMCRFVMTIDDQVVAWIALSPVSNRCVYEGVSEVSLYVDPRFKRQGIGCELLNHIVKESEQNSIWMLQASIFPENEASIALHKKCGFRIVGIREKIGRMGGLWRDYVLLERRSDVVGI